MSIRIVQEKLRAAGFNPGDLDGRWGTDTEAALDKALAAATYTRLPDPLQPGRLSPHFTLAELTVSAEGARRGLNNIPTGAELAALRATATGMETVRRLLGDRAITVFSGYRSPEVNRAVGGAAASAHMSGHAVDFICPGFGSSAKVAAHLAKTLPAGSYDQIIEEFGQWVHIGFGPGKRGQKLTARKAGGKTVYSPEIAA